MTPRHARSVHAVRRHAAAAGAAVLLTVAGSAVADLRAPSSVTPASGGVAPRAVAAFPRPPRTGVTPADALGPSAAETGHLPQPPATRPPATRPASTTPTSTIAAEAGGGASARRRERAVRAAVAAAVRGRRGTVDLAITDVAGRQVVHAGRGAPVRTASIVKLLVLRAVQAGGPPTRAERTLARRMITRSDNEATTRLWRASGRDRGIARAAAALGMTHTTRIHDLLLPWDGWQTTAEDQERLLVALSRGRSAAARFTRELMAHVVPAQRWGVGSVTGATGVKNGWLPVRGRWIVNSDGCVARATTTLCVSVLSTGSRTFGEGVRTVERAAAAAVRAWTGR